MKRWCPHCWITLLGERNRARIRVKMMRAGIAAEDTRGWVMLFVFYVGIPLLMLSPRFVQRAIGRLINRWLIWMGMDQKSLDATKDN